MAVTDEGASVAAATMAGHSRIVRWLTWTPWILLLLGLAIQAKDPGQIMTSLRFPAFDFFQRQAPRAYVDPREVTGTGVKYVDIDAASLAKIGQWPWPRTILADLVHKLKDAGAKVVVFDIVFAEPDRTSPNLILASLPSSPDWDGTRQQLQSLPNHDAVFAGALAEMPTVVGFIMSNSKGGSEPKIKAGASSVGDQPAAQFLNAFRGATISLAQLEASAPGNGALNTITDDDGIVRRVPILLALRKDISDPGKMVPTIAAEALRLLAGKRGFVAKTPGASDEANFGGSTGVTAIQAGKTIVPTTNDGQIWIHFTAPVPSRVISAHEVLSGKVDASRIKDSIVFVGTSAEGLLDIRSTPVTSRMAGVEIQVMAVEQMLLKHFLARPDWALGAELAFSAILGLVVLLLIRRVSPYWIAAVAASAVAFAVGYSWYSYVETLTLFDPIGPSLVVTFVFAAAGLVRFMETEVERRTVRSAFAQYLPPGVVEEIARDPSKLKLGGDTRVLTVMFCDIRGFTAIAESFRTDPQSLTRLINRVLTPLSQAVLDSGGTIDKYIGDCIMAFWNAPLDDLDHPRHACECAMAMQEKLQTLNRQLDAEGFYQRHKVKRIGVGVGLNSGPCVVGNMGSDMRFDYSALGDAVNLAARYQSLSGHYGSFIVVGEDTQKIIPDAFAYMQIDYVVVKGRAEPTFLYALMGHPHVKETEAFRALDAALMSIFAAIVARDWQAARAAILAGRALPGVDRAIFDTYADRIDYWETNPPPQNWKGAWTALEK